MKFPGEASERVARSLRDVGPAAAPELASRLGLSATAVRRSLAALVDAGLAVSGDRAPYGPAPAPRRGRPSHVYSLTAAGQAACGQAYDDLAIDTLRFLREHAGADAVRAFADQRAARLVSRLDPSASHNPVGRVESIADALTDAGYAANVVRTSATTVQLCQHACPVVEAASEFPELCEAEAAALGKAMGVHVTRLATLAHGDGVCTTVVPINATVHTREVPAREVPAQKEECSA